ncbi:alpha-1,2-fucosyltransferase [Methylococcus sp. EFPC2]|uniref:alpha-1,2-fucosyltransferase n=1 Tax=Methylococcus sp. EFPC2 TaxID=2812648 RepID=UPI001967B137|nr:alpha-1,2-fucosyltransferase [Methylococcus sp. EFPC2]QSA95909.1 alpha-1,2-fucosyltransferase [Methylococcus sp. EFPC2]
MGGHKAIASVQSTVQLHNPHASNRTGLNQEDIAMHSHEAPAKKLISMSTLGRNGRFGNQVFQYAFLRIYAEKYGLNLQTPDWIGQVLFGHSEPEPAVAHKQVKEAEHDFLGSLREPMADAPHDIDLWGYFLFHTSHYRPYKSLFTSLFRPVPDIKTELENSLGKLRREYGTLIGMHLRRGDFGYGNYFIPPNKWYKKWLSELWERELNPVLFIASDEPVKVIRDFRKYNPVTAEDIGAHMERAEFYPDFFILSQCDALAISNSTFSFSAAMLNGSGRLFARPNCIEKRLTSFDPWNSDPLLECSNPDIALRVGQKIEILKGRLFNRMSKLEAGLTQRWNTKHTV